MAQDVEGSLGSPRMLHGHLHHLHASSISYMLNRRVFTKYYHIDGGKLLQYKLIYSSRTRMYNVLKKVPKYWYPLYCEYSKFELISHG